MKIQNNHDTNKFNNKSVNYLNKKRYSTISYTNNSIEFSSSDRLNSIIKELGVNPVYIFENLNLENTRKQILKENLIRNRNREREMKNYKENQI